MKHRERLPVALGVIFNHAGDKVLLSKRPQHVHLGGLWEFPGGKLHHGESSEQALRRELYEELGLVVEKASPLMCLEHDYPALKVRLDVWTVEQWQGKPGGRLGQEIEWVMLARLARLGERRFPVASRYIVSSLSERKILRPL